MNEITELFRNYCEAEKYGKQLERYYFSLKDKPLTMLEASVQTGIMRENLCRYTATLRKAGLIAGLKKRQCSISKMQATEWTSDVELFPSFNQTTIFD